MANVSEQRDPESVETPGERQPPQRWHHVGFVVVSALVAVLGVVWRCT